MTGFIERALDSAWLWLIARICLAVVFAASGLAKLVDFEGGLAEMRAAGLEPAILFNLLTAATLLGGSAAILADRLVWLGAGALVVFLVATILVVHTFWSKTGPEAQIALFFALEHVSVAGGLIAAAIASDQRRRLRWRG